MAAGIINQIRRAFQKQNRLASVVGACIGSFIPVACHTIIHRELDFSVPLSAQPKAWLVLAGMTFSALSVFKVGQAAFKSNAKALGFTVLLEGTMAASSTGPLVWAALGILVFLNAVSVACNLSDDQQAANRGRRAAPAEEAPEPEARPGAGEAPEAEAGPGAGEVPGADVIPLSPVRAVAATSPAEARVRSPRKRAPRKGAAQLDAPEAPVPPPTPEVAPSEGEVLAAA